MLRKRSRFAVLICCLFIAVILSCTKSKSFDGEWSGTTSQEKSINFTVKDHGIFYVSADFFFDFGFVSSSGPAEVRNYQKPITHISGNKFSTQVSQRITVTGMFSSNTTASGTVRCTINQVEREATWTATKVK